MDELNTFGLIFSITIAVLSAATAFLYRDKTKRELEYFQRNNGELREDNDDKRQRLEDVHKQLATAEVICTEQGKRIVELKEQNSKQADFAEISKLILGLSRQQDNNHKEIVKLITTSNDKRNRT